MFFFATLTAIFLTFSGVLAQIEYYPCLSATCIQNTYCRVKRVDCITAPCKPQVLCADFISNNNVCPSGKPVLQIDGRNDIRCSVGANQCPDYTDCLNGYCCWTGILKNVPVDKAGLCPDTRGLAGACVELCSNDASCGGSQKCCSNGCGHVCTNPITSKPGTCPVPSTTGSCTSTCTTDSQCPDSEKCCFFNTCGSVCSATAEDTVKAGTCPVQLTAGLCISTCSSDSQCTGSQKCCSNGCGRACFVTVEDSVKPGSCPAQTTSGPCVNLCSTDRDCQGQQKCCSNGCGQVCLGAIFAVDKPGTCPANNIAPTGPCTNDCFQDGDCPGDKKCCSRGCNRQCLDIIETPRPGTCPLSSNLPICANACRFDGECPSNQKCCSNSCGKSCVRTDTEKPGQCPANEGPFDTACVSRCTNDASCSGTHKCCSRGCGRECRPIVRNLPACSTNFYVYFCFFQTHCEHDSDCGRGQTCCESNGCGKICGNELRGFPYNIFVPYSSTNHYKPSRCTWWKFIYGECQY